MRSIYLDHSSTTPVRPEVVEAMLPFWTDRFGNAGSIHAFGRSCRRAVDDARDQVAALIDAHPRDIVFTSGGTESDNLAVRGIPGARPPGRRGILVSAVEHHAVLHAAEAEAKHDGGAVRILPVSADGVADVGALEALADDSLALVSVMHANNETGVIQPVAAVAEWCCARGIPFHCDVVQSIGKIPFSIKALPVAMLAISAHKLNGPKGVGACYIRKGTEFVPQMSGGFQERERRAGTENVAGIVGFGKACEIAKRDMDTVAARMRRLRDALQSGILERIPESFVNGAQAERLPHLLNIRFAGVEGESVVLALDVEGVAVSSGSTCSSGAVEASHVLLAMGQTHAEAQSAVRFSLGHSTTEAEIDEVLALLPGVIERIRRATPRPTSAPI